LEKALKHTWFSPNPLDCVTQLMPEMQAIEATDMAQLDALELFPQALRRIEFGGIWRLRRVAEPAGRVFVDSSG
jgi:hypothetical protein